MTKTLSLGALALGLALQAQAFDLGGAVDKAAAAAKDPGKAAASVGDAAGQKAMQEMNKKLNKVQNEKGPIVFANGKADLIADKCLNTLKAIDGIVKQYPLFKVTVQGHTDNKGKKDANQALSQARAQAVVAWLTANLQTPAERLEAKGFGDSKPIADNKSEKGRAKNRRVDFSVSKL